MTRSRSWRRRAASGRPPQESPRATAQELSPHVRVNAVAPGPVLWPENNEEFNEIYKQRVISQTLLKKIGSPEDVAMAVKFLVLDAPFITGHILAVDGGRSISL